MLMTLFREFLNICLLQRAPQDLPASGTLLVVSLLFSGLGSVIIASGSLDPLSAVFAALLEIVFLCVAIYVLLSVCGLRQRWLQTVTAIAGVNAVLLLFALPLFAWMLWLQSRSLNASLPLLLFYGLIIWNVMILGHIFRHALSTLLPLGVLVALVYYSTSIILINSLIPVQATN